MILFASLAAALALQSAPDSGSANAANAPGSGEPSVTSFDQLPIEQAAAPRCAVVFALVSRWQKADDPRGEDYADIEQEGGREFFVQAMARLMEQRELSREALMTLVSNEVETLGQPGGEERVAAMMPACALMMDA